MCDQHGLDSSLVARVQGIIDRCNRPEVAPNTAFEDIWETCEAEILSCETVKLHPDQLA